MAEETNHKPYRLGLALSGGGAKGFAHIGVFRMMEECALRPDIIVGTSAGALMGALFADGYSAAEIQELFTGREFSEFAQLQIPKAGLFDSKRFRYFLRRHLRTKNIEDLQIPLVVVATDLDNGESHEFRSGPIVEAVTASCSIPIIFSPVVINGVHYVTPRLCTNFIILQVVRFFQLVCKFLCKFTENYSRNGTNNSRQYCRSYDFRRVHAPILASEGNNIDRDQLQG